MNRVDETRVITNLRLTDFQKKVLTKVVASPTETVAGEEISQSRNLVAARRLLVRLGLVNYVDGKATVTDSGMRVMREENLIDEMGELTDEGRKYAFDEEDQQTQSAETPPAAPSEGPAVEPEGQAGPLQMASFDLLKTVANKVTLHEQLKEVKNGRW